MEDLLDNLPFKSAIKLALIEHSGELGELLSDMIHYEKGEWSEINNQMLAVEKYAKYFMDAIFWSEQQLKGFDD